MAFMIVFSDNVGCCSSRPVTSGVRFYFYVMSLLLRVLVVT